MHAERNHIHTHTHTYVWIRYFYALFAKCSGACSGLKESEKKLQSIIIYRFYFNKRDEQFMITLLRLGASMTMIIPKRHCCYASSYRTQVSFIIEKRIKNKSRMKHTHTHTISESKCLKEGEERRLPPLNSFVCVIHYILRKWTVIYVQHWIVEYGVVIASPKLYLHKGNSILLTDDAFWTIYNKISTIPFFTLQIILR